ncbi:putative dimethyl sulfoxide reductase chain YnfE precursor [bacterium BMS3Bbin10]|nr:putative dimethyl sulfoxide reductase chain YnfE precursor [bacterium BMS3Bbin10]
MDARIPIGYSACPHDCPSTCALEVELPGGNRIGRVRGARDNSYTAGVICAKVARYTERIHHPGRLMTPLRRKGEKGSRDFEPVSWDDALNITAEKLLEAEARYGAEAVWPYYFAGTMGLLMRDGINRLRHAKRYSRQFSTICTTLADTGFMAGTGKIMGPDPREMARADLVVLWGTNAVATQVNVMTHATRARRERGAKIAVVDVYNNATMQQADIPVIIRPGTDGALACAVMHVLFRDGYADRKFLDDSTDCPREFEEYLKSRTPQWAAGITGLPVQEIDEFAKAIGTTPRSYFRLGYGFTRSRNGSINMHAASCIPSVTGAWAHEGGGAFYSNKDIYSWDKTMIEGLDAIDPDVRMLDLTRIGAVLTGEEEDIGEGPPVTALFIQNMNPVAVAPDQRKVRAGFARDDLFVCVHEQFMTETAQLADIVLPATMFLEHDDFYQGGGHQHILLGPRLIEPPGECRSNHDVICALAERVGAEHPGFEMTARELIDHTLRVSGWGALAELEAKRWIDCQPDFETAHFRGGFGWPDGKFRFRPDWENLPYSGVGFKSSNPRVPEFPDYWEVIEGADEAHPFRLVTPPARNYLNTTFSETPTSQAKEGAPAAMIHPGDLAELGIKDGARIKMGNERGEIKLLARAFEGVQRGVVIVEAIPKNDKFEGGEGINTLTGADSPSPFGGAAFHDNHVWIREVV